MGNFMMNLMIGGLFVMFFYQIYKGKNKGAGTGTGGATKGGKPGTGSNQKGGWF
jgi:hypothetical protein